MTHASVYQTTQLILRRVFQTDSTCLVPSTTLFRRIRRLEIEHFLLGRNIEVKLRYDILVAGIIGFNNAA
jgi:hypothetical protein